MTTSIAGTIAVPRYGTMQLTGTTVVSLERVQ